MPYPNAPKFKEKQLKELQDQGAANFNFKVHYDVKGYLSQLKIVAHQLDTHFHKTLTHIMGVDADSTNADIGLTYSAGPVKRLARCQAKAEVKF